GRKGIRPAYVLLILVVAIAGTAGITYWLLANYLFPREFEPVQLKAQEERVLKNKLRVIGIDNLEPGTAGVVPLEPEPYSEVGARREIAFTDRGFWRSFSEGMEYLRVEDGRMIVKLKE
ncbi:MAG: hypothetical protein ACLFUE_07505, partial [Desulfobacteraceae bacterium]